MTTTNKNAPLLTFDIETDGMERIFDSWERASQLPYEDRFVIRAQDHMPTLVLPRRGMPFSHQWAPAHKKLNPNRDAQKAQRLARRNSR